MPKAIVTLKDIYEVVNRLEDKMDRRMCIAEEKIDVLESFKDDMAGKITLITGIFSLCFSLLWQWIKGKLNQE